LTKQFLRTRPPITKAIRFFRTLSAQNVSTLNWVLFGCSFTTDLLQKQKKGFGKIKNGTHRAVFQHLLMEKINA
jgi:hypothetical protein